MFRKMSGDDSDLSWNESGAGLAGLGYGNRSIPAWSADQNPTFGLWVAISARDVGRVAIRSSGRASALW